MTKDREHQLIENIIVKTQCFVGGNISDDDDKPLETFRRLLNLYKGIDKEMLRANMKYWLEQIMPVCDEYGMNMCVHPDDPPMPILGLPRIITSADDIRWLLEAVPNFHNGVTFCCGSLSAGAHNDVNAMAREFAPRIHFAHIRRCKVMPNRDFKEDAHLGKGRTDLIDIVRVFEQECQRRKNDGAYAPDEINTPMRVDHAPLMLGDDKCGYNAGYSFHGRMLALGQISGVMAAIEREIDEI